MFDIEQVAAYKWFDAIADQGRVCDAENVSLQVFQHLFERRCAGLPQQFIDHHLRR